MSVVVVAVLRHYYEGIMYVLLDVLCCRGYQASVSAAGDVMAILKPKWIK